MRDALLVLNDVTDAIERLVELGRAVSPSTLAEHRGLGEQVLYNLIVLGEAAKRLDAGTRLRFPDVDWTSMAQTGDRLVHHYESVDWEVVAQILSCDLPPLAARVHAIRAALSAEAGRVS